MHTFPTPAPFRLDLRNPSGEVQVTVVDGLETTVALHSMNDTDEERRAIDAARVELRDRHGHPEVYVDVPARRGGLLGRSAQVHVEVRCPRAGSAEIQTKSADVRVHGTIAGLGIKTVSGDVSIDEIEGDARVNTTSGDVSLDLVRGSLELNTISGDVRLQRALGPVNANLISGDISVDEAHDTLTVNTVSGDQRVQAVRDGEVVLHSVSGDVRVGIARGSRVWLDVRTISGDAASELEMSEGEPAEGDGPLVVLQGNTVSGDFTVVRGPALAHA